jgi:hypothetical protein
MDSLATDVDRKGERLQIGYQLKPYIEEKNQKATITARSHHHIRQCLYNQILTFTANANGGKFTSEIW